MEENKLCPEEELLILCTQENLHSEQIHQIQTILKKKIDWSYFLQITHRHRLIPLVYPFLSKFFVEEVPPSALAEFRKSFQIYSRSMVFKTGDLVKILGLFQKQNIPVIPYKGPTLAMLLFKHIALRQYVDLDIFIHKQNVLTAKALLESQGYKASREPTTREQEFLLEHAFEQTFSKNCTNIDLHWGLDFNYLSSSGLNDEDLWKNLKEVSLGGKTVLTFSPENLALILCFHGAKHAWKQLNWICDIAELVRQYPPLNWERVLMKAHQLHGERRLFLGLHLAQNICSIRLPIKIEQEIDKNKLVKALAQKIKRRFFKKRNGFARFLDDRIYLLTLERFIERVRHLWQYSKPTLIEWKLLDLPKSFYVFYYLIRPIRLIEKYIFKLRPIFEKNVHVL